MRRFSLYLEEGRILKQTKQVCFCIGFSLRGEDGGYERGGL